VESFISPHVLFLLWVVVEVVDEFVVHFEEDCSTKSDRCDFVLDFVVVEPHSAVSAGALGQLFVVDFDPFELTSSYESFVFVTDSLISQGTPSIL